MNSKVKRKPKAPAASASAGAGAGTGTGTGTGPSGDDSDAVFASAAELFRLLATPMRLKIISALCGHEKNVSQL